MDGFFLIQFDVLLVCCWCFNCTQGSHVLHNDDIACFLSTDDINAVSMQHIIALVVYVNLLFCIKMQYLLRNNFSFFLVIYKFSFGHFFYQILSSYLIPTLGSENLLCRAFRFASEDL